MTTSKEAFESAYKQKFGFSPDMATPEAQMLFWAWQACDAYWREKLQSEEMVEEVAFAAEDYLDKYVILQGKNDDMAREVLAAISKEVTK